MKKRLLARFIAISMAISGAILGIRVFLSPIAFAGPTLPTKHSRPFLCSMAQKTGLSSKSCEKLAATRASETKRIVLDNPNRSEENCAHWIDNISLNLALLTGFRSAERFRIMDPCDPEGILNEKSTCQPWVSDTIYASLCEYSDNDISNDFASTNGPKGSEGCVQWIHTAIVKRSSLEARDNDLCEPWLDPSVIDSIRSLKHD